MINCISAPSIINSIKKNSYILLLIAIVLLTLSWFFKDYLQASMALHMLVQIPMIMFAGVFFSLYLSYQILSNNHPSNNIHLNQFKSYKALSKHLKKFNQLGISGFLFVSLVSMYWMIPKALDQVLISQYAQLSKYLSVFIAGLVIHVSYKASHTVVRLFFIGAICWTMAIVGLLYQETDVRLCNFYLISDQQWAGRGLVILAIILPTCWIISEALQYRRKHAKQD